MREFGWSIEYALDLSFPQFMALGSMIGRVRADAAIDGVFSAYCAGKYGGKSAKSLFKARGAFFKDGNGDNPRAYSKELLEIAEKRCDELLEKAQRKD